MYKYFGYIFLFTSLAFFACEDPLQKEREQLYKEVMVIHDEMMPLVRNDIRPTQKKLETMIKEAINQQDADNASKYQTAFNQLEKADKAMNDWMRQFVTPPDEMSNQDAVDYLKDQKIKVAKMKKVMEDNMNAARKVIEF